MPSSAASAAMLRAFLARRRDADLEMLGHVAPADDGIAERLTDFGALPAAAAR
jgi:hypothetical protein